MPKVFLYRGIVGSGKTFLVQKHHPYAKEQFRYFSTDDYWGDPYDFRPELIGKAHEWNYKRFLDRLAHDAQNLAGKPDLVVDNTNISSHEIAPYILASTAFGYEHEIITLWTDPIIAMRRQTHNVPPHVVLDMYRRLITEQLPLFWKHRVIYPES